MIPFNFSNFFSKEKENKLYLQTNFFGGVAQMVRAQDS